MKKYLPHLILLLWTLFFCMTSKAQSVVATLDRNITTHTTSYALTGGTLNDKGDSFTGGVILNDYGRIKMGLRAQVQIMITDWAYFNTCTDIYANRNTDPGHEFLEVSAGLGLEYQSFQLNLRYLASTYNNVAKVKTRDNAVLSLGYKVKWRR